MNQGADQIHAVEQQKTLQGAAGSANTRPIAETAEAIWLDIDAALTPIVGARGVDALYKRSISIIRKDYPWVQVALDKTSDHKPFVLLRRALAEQSPATAASANHALLQSFHHLLANLIGVPLATRLLEPVLRKSSNEA
jgi:hypothetical protein